MRSDAELSLALSGGDDALLKLTLDPPNEFRFRDACTG